MEDLLWDSELSQKVNEWVSLTILRKNTSTADISVVFQLITEIPNMVPV